jgi:hypothetical protein
LVTAGFADAVLLKVALAVGDGVVIVASAFREDECVGERAESQGALQYIY